MALNGEQNPWKSLQTAIDVCEAVGSSPSKVGRLLRSARLYRHKPAKRAKASGEVRILSVPCPELKAMQKKIAKWLQSVPLSNAVHGWRPGRSTVTNAAVHVGRRFVATRDLRDFFGSVRPERVKRVFMQLGCGKNAADILARICTHDFRLPQGAPTSPALANLSMAVIDAGIGFLASREHLRYTRQGDDLAFSGTSISCELLANVEMLIAGRGMRLNHLKDRLMPSDQPQEICGIVVNSRLDVPQDRKHLARAMVDNCVNNGLQAEARPDEGLRNVINRIEGHLSYIQAANPQFALAEKRRFRRGVRIQGQR